MSGIALTAEEIMAWSEKTSAGWHQLLEKHPEVLSIPCDVMGVTTVGGLLQHIVAVELRYAERLASLPMTEYAEVAFDSAAAIYTTHAKASSLYRDLLATSDFDWEAPMEFLTQTQGRLRATRRAIFFHALLHSQRHYAQLATLVRQHGVKPELGMDYLLVAAERV